MMYFSLLTHGCKPVFDLHKLIRVDTYIHSHIYPYFLAYCELFRIHIVRVNAIEREAVSVEAVL